MISHLPSCLPLDSSYTLITIEECLDCLIYRLLGIRKADLLHGSRMFDDFTICLVVSCRN